MNKLIVGAAASLVLALGFTGFGNRTGTTVGKYAPELKIENVVDGRSTSLTDNDGKATLLHFWSYRDADSRYQSKIYHLALQGAEAENLNYVSVNLDDYDAIAREIVGIDGLDLTRQFTPATTAEKVRKDFRLYNELPTFLIDSRGEILSVNPSVDDLKKLGLI